MPPGAGERIRGEVRSQFGRLTEDLADLVAIPSVSALGFPEETQPALLQAHEAIVELLRDAGVEQLGSIDLPDTAPVITGEIPAPDGAPTVLLYSHYDVVGAGDESKWESPPFEASEREGAIFGRGSADSKSNILMHVGAIRAWGGAPPVGIKIVIEGQEESGSPLIDFPATRPELFASDAMVIGDMGSLRPGVPTLTIGLRGMAAVIVEARTLAGPKHSGQFGGAAPDALGALLRGLAALHDEHGDVAVPGLRREEWTGASYSEDEFRELAEVEPDVPLVGTGGLGGRRGCPDRVPVDRLRGAVGRAAESVLQRPDRPEPEDAVDRADHVVRDVARPRLRGADRRSPRHRRDRLLLRGDLEGLGRADPAHQQPRDDAARTGRAPRARALRRLEGDVASDGAAPRRSSSLVGPDHLGVGADVRRPRGALSRDRPAPDPGDRTDDRAPGRLHRRPARSQSSSS